MTVPGASLPPGAVPLECTWQAPWSQADLVLAPLSCVQSAGMQGLVKLAAIVLFQSKALGQQLASASSVC